MEAACRRCEGTAKMPSDAADEVEAQARKGRTFQWRNWEAKPAEGGASMTHAWTKEAVGLVQRWSNMRIGHGLPICVSGPHRKSCGNPSRASGLSLEIPALPTVTVGGICSAPGAFKTLSLTTDLSFSDG